MKLQPAPVRRRVLGKGKTSGGGQGDLQKKKSKVGETRERVTYLRFLAVSPKFREIFRVSMEGNLSGCVPGLSEGEGGSNRYFSLGEVGA